MVPENHMESVLVEAYFPGDEWSRLVVLSDLINSSEWNPLEIFYPQNQTTLPLLSGRYQSVLVEIEKSRQFKPSTFDAEYWIPVDNPHIDKSHINYSLVGKWMIFRKWDLIDETWHRVSLSVIQNKLGCSAKVSTRKDNPNSLDQNERVICVFTSNHNDMDDVRRVLQGLRNIGIDDKIRYKTDEMTYAGVYSVNGQRSSKWSSDDFDL